MGSSWHGAVSQSLGWLLTCYICTRNVRQCVVYKLTSLNVHTDPVIERSQLPTHSVIHSPVACVHAHVHKGRQAASILLPHQQLAGPPRVLPLLQQPQQHQPCKAPCMAPVRKCQARQPDHQVPAELLWRAGIKLENVAVMPGDVVELLQLCCYATDEQLH